MVVIEIINVVVAKNCKQHNRLGLDTFVLHVMLCLTLRGISRPYGYSCVDIFTIVGVMVVLRDVYRQLLEKHTPDIVFPLVVCS